MGKVIKWTEEEINYAIENMNVHSYKEIGKVLGRTRSAVMVKMNKLGYKLIPKNSFNIEYFKKIDSSNKAYWFGFICADGYISFSSKNRQYCLGIELQRGDKNHLSKFNKDIQGNIEIFDRERFLEFRNRSVFLSNIRFYSKPFVEDLINLGLVVRKSMVITFPKIEEEFMNHFIRGYFDGNGSISLEKKSNQLRCNFTCGSKIFLDELKNILDKLSIHSYVGKSSKTSNAFQLGITSKKSTKIFLEYIYKESETCLDRKYNYYIANKNLLSYINNGWE